MNALKKFAPRVVLAALGLGLLAGLWFLLKWLVPLVGGFLMGGAVQALSVVGVTAAPAAAAWFFVGVFMVVLAMRGSREVRK